MDYQIFLSINGLAGKIKALDSVAVFLASDWMLALAAVVVAIFWWKKTDLRKNVYLAISSILVSRVLVVEFLKRAFNRQRPYEILPAMQKLIMDNERGLSFPSGHATIYFALAFAFWKTPIFRPLAILAIIASLARIFVGVHYPSDILVGAVIGAALSLSMRKLFVTK